MSENQNAVPVPVPGPITSPQIILSTDISIPEPEDLKNDEKEAEETDEISIIGENDGQKLIVPSVGNQRAVAYSAAVGEIIGLARSLFPMIQQIWAHRYTLSIFIFNQSPLELHRTKGWLKEGFLGEMPPEIYSYTEEKILLGATRLTPKGIRGIISFLIRGSNLRFVLLFSNPIVKSNKTGLAFIHDEEFDRKIYKDLKGLRKYSKNWSTEFGDKPNYDRDYARAKDLKSAEISICSKEKKGKKMLEFLSISCTINDGKNANVKVLIKSRLSGPFQSMEILKKVEEKAQVLEKMANKEKNLI